MIISGKTTMLMATILSVFSYVSGDVSHSGQHIVQHRLITQHQTGQRTLLLAHIIRQRYSQVSKTASIHIARSINRYTRGKTWPTPLDVAAIIEVESQYNPHAVSATGAKGLMQLSQVWTGKFPASAYHGVTANIRYGIQLLSKYYTLYHDNPMAAILVYNSGRYAYNSGQAWSTYWWRFQSAKQAFQTIYTNDVAIKNRGV